MAYYKTCPFCGASLDPGERCDCQEKAAQDTANIQGGKVEQASYQLNYSGAIVQNEQGECQA